MRNTYFISSLLLLIINLSGQTVNWAHNVNTKSKTTGLVCDQAGNVYLYGCGVNTTWTGNLYQSYPIEENGSFIYKYSPSGELLMSRKFDVPFFIHKMIYDGISSFYFTGAFSGDLTFNGQSISSHGGFDGVIGKMNEQGEILWVKGFGGSKTDLGNSLTFNSQKNSLVVTGGINDTFFVNDKLVSVAAQRSVLLASFDLNGALLDHSLIDFLPSKNFNNCGYEIITTSSGNYFLLAEREGRTYDGDSTIAPPDGKYVFKIDPSFNILWSKLIIGSDCYYGYQSAKMSCGNNAAYVPRFCSSKYGGEGAVLRLNENDGTPEWTLNNKDGSYNDTYSYGSDIFMVGTEGASICPCPENDFGHEVVKKLDDANNEELLLSVAKCRLTNITCNNRGVIYVFGNTYETIQIGTHQVGEGSFLFAIGAAQQVATSVKEENPEIFQLYPNPSEGKVEVQLSPETSAAPVTVTVYNILGEHIYSGTILPENNGHFIILLADRPKGSYIVEISSPSIKQVRQLILR